MVCKIKGMAKQNLDASKKESMKEYAFKGNYENRIRLRYGSAVELLTSLARYKLNFVFKIEV